MDFEESKKEWNDSNKAPSVKKRRKKNINWYVLISFFLLILGGELTAYFYIGMNNFLDKIPILFITENIWCFSCILMMIPFLVGNIYGILSMKEEKTKIASIVLSLLNFLAFLAVVAILGISIYEGHTTTATYGDEQLDNSLQVDENLEETLDEFFMDRTLTEDNDQQQTLQSSNEIRTDELQTIQAQTKNHRYEYFVINGTWEDAYRECLAKGGHLVTFETEEEYLQVCMDLVDHNQQDYVFFIGGRRDLNTKEYYWIDGNNSLIGEVLNDPNIWIAKYWFSNEPSFKDVASGTEEHVLSIFYHNDAQKWVWNDEANDVLSVVSDYEGRVGYICEFES